MLPSFCSALKLFAVIPLLSTVITEGFIWQILFTFFVSHLGNSFKLIDPKEIIRSFQQRIFWPLIYFRWFWGRIWSPIDLKFFPNFTEWWRFPLLVVLGSFPLIPTDEVPSNRIIRGTRRPALEAFALCWGRIRRKAQRESYHILFSGARGQKKV